MWVVLPTIHILLGRGRCREAWLPELLSKMSSLQNVELLNILNWVFKNKFLLKTDSLPSPTLKVMGCIFKNKAEAGSLPKVILHFPF